MFLHLRNMHLNVFVSLFKLKLNYYLHILIQLLKHWKPHLIVTQVKQTMFWFDLKKIRVGSKRCLCIKLLWHGVSVQALFFASFMLFLIALHLHDVRIITSFKLSAVNYHFWSKLPKLYISRWGIFTKCLHIFKLFILWKSIWPRLKKTVHHESKTFLSTNKVVV